MIDFKNILKKEIIAILLLFISSFAFSQDRECDVYISNNPIGKGVSVRWIGKQISYQEGVNIFRKENNGEWVLLTSSPIMPPKTLNSNIQLSENGNQMFDVYLNQTHEEFLDGFGGIFTVIESVKEYNLALALNIAYNDETAVIGNEYQYKIEAKIKGVNTTLGITKSITCQPFAADSCPENITVERKKKKINIKWTNDIEKYFAFSIYQKIEDGEWTLIGDRIASTAITDNPKKPIITRKTSPDTAYTYKICGHDYFGQQSEMSKEFVMEVQDFVPPAIPTTSIEVKSKKMSVRVSWSQNIDEDLSHYNIYRSLDPDKFNIRLNKEDIPKEDTVYLDYPENAGSYFYIVEAIDLSGNKSKSLFVNGTVYDIRPPIAPKNLISRVDTGKLIFNWDANLEVDLKGYRLYRSVADEDNSDNNFVVVSSETIDTNFYMEPMSKNVRSKFVYQLRAVDSSYNVSEPSNRVFAQLPDVTPPVAPFIKKTYEEDNALIIEWMPNVEKDLMGYNLYKRMKGDTADFEQLNISPIPKSVITYKDAQAERGQFYEYYMQAVDLSKLVSPVSNDVLGKLEFIPLSGKFLIKKSKLNKLKQEFVLEWSLDSLINEPVIGTSIHKSINGSKAMQVGSVSKKLIFKEKLTKTGKYEYHIRAYGKRGNMIKSEIIKIEFEKK